MNMLSFGSSDGLVSSPDGLAGMATQHASVVKQYLSILKRRKWIIIGSTAAALLIGLVVTMLMTPAYTASSVIEIQRETRNFAMVQGADPSAETSSADVEFYQTQYGLLETRSLAERVARDLSLYDDVGFFEMFDSPIVDDWFENGKVIEGASSRDERVRAAGDILLAHIEIGPQRLSRLVAVRFTSPEAEFSQRVVDAWVQHFIAATFERRFEATAYARKFLEQRLAQLRARLDEAERSLVQYAAREGIVNLQTSGAEGDQSGRSLVAQNLASLNAELSEATAERIRAQSRLEASGSVVQEGLNNAAITTIRAERAALASDYAAMMMRFEPAYPPARALKAQIDQLDRSLEREESRVESTLQETYEAALQRERILRGRVASLQDDVLDLRRRSIQYNIYQRDLDTNRELYDGLLQRYKEIGVAGGIGVSNILVVDPAELPLAPSSPKLLLNLLLSLFGGMVLGVAVAFGLEQIDEGIGDPAEVEQRLGLPLLGTVPRAEGNDPMDSLTDRKSALSEAYLSLQTRLAFSTDHGVPRSLGITSSRPAEGKTTTSFALARALARSNRRTILIDGDMRSPSIHALMGVPNEKGLSNYLSGEDDLDLLIAATESPGLFVMAAGPQPPNAAELLSGSRLERLLSSLLERFDHVVIDAPPVMGLADAPLIGSQVEATVFVLEAHRTKRGMARVALSRMQGARAHLAGVILTKFDSQKAHYGYGYDYGYEYGYGPATEAVNGSLNKQ